MRYVVRVPNILPQELLFSNFSAFTYKHTSRKQHETHDQRVCSPFIFFLLETLLCLVTEARLNVIFRDQ